MRNMTDEQRRHEFRDWLKAEMRRLDFWRRRGNHYFISEFVRYAREQGAQIEAVPFGRWIRDENPVLPDADSCRELARALGMSSVEVLLAAGRLHWDEVAYIVDEFARGNDGVPYHRGRGVRATPQLPPVDPRLHQGAATGDESGEAQRVREAQRR